MAADPLNDHPPPGGGSVPIPAALIVTAETACTSSPPPDAAVNAASTDDGSLTATDRYRFPFTHTDILPPETATPMTCVPDRRLGTFVEVAAKARWPFETPVAMPMKLFDGSPASLCVP